MINIYLGLFAKNLYICKLIIEYKMAKKNTNLTESKTLAQLIAQGMSDKKAQNITILDLRNVVGAPSSFFVICTGNSPLHTQAISDNIHEIVKKTTNEHSYKLEGYNNGEWVLMDYFDVVAHIFVEKTREYYRLEQLWADGIMTEIKE